MFGNILGNTLINAIAVAVLTALSGGSSNYTRGAFIKFAVILGIICLVGTLLTYFTTSELKDTDSTQEKQKEEKIDTKASILSLLKNKYWLMQLLNTVFVYLGLYTRLAVMIYYGLYVLGNPGLVAVLVIADNVPGLIAMPFALAVSNKIGKRKAALGGLLLTMIGCAIKL